MFVRERERERAMSSAARGAGSGSGILGCLATLLSADERTRKGAESFLNRAERECPAVLVRELCAVISAESAPLHLRQLACILLKNFVKVHWRADVPRFVPPLLGAEDKLLVKRTVTQLLGVKDTKLRTAVALCIATIVAWEWPEEWPSAITDLISCLRLDDRSWVKGSLIVLETFVSAHKNLAPQKFQYVVEALFPELLRIFVSPEHYDAWTRQCAASIFLQCMQVLSLRETEFPEEAITSIFGKNVPSWVLAFSATLIQPKTCQPEHISLRVVVAETLSLLFSCFDTHMKPYVQQMVPHLWTCFSQTCSLYESEVIFDRGTFRAEPDENGEVPSVARLMNVLIECFSALLQKQSFRSSLESLRKDLVLAVIRALQITTEQEELWIDDPDAYLGDEDDETLSTSVRPVAREFLETFADCYSDGAWVTLTAAALCLNDANTLRTTAFQNKEQKPKTTTSSRSSPRRHSATPSTSGGDTVDDDGDDQNKESERSHARKAWWRLREAALFAIGIVERQAKTDTAHATKVISEVRNLLTTLMAADVSLCQPLLQTAQESSQQQGSKQSASRGDKRVMSDSDLPSYVGFLVGRAMWCAACYSNVIPAGESLPFFHVAALLIQQQRHANSVLLLSVCRALTLFTTNIPASAIAPYMPGLLLVLSNMIQEAESDDTLSMLLETLGACIAVSPDATGLYEQVVTAGLLNIWAKRAAEESLMSNSIVESLEQIVHSPKCFEGLVQRILPAVAEVLDRHSACFGIVPSALELLNDILDWKDWSVSERSRMAPSMKQCFSGLIKYITSSPADCELAYPCFRHIALQYVEFLPQWTDSTQLVPKMLEKLSDCSEMTEDSAVTLAQLFTYTIELMLPRNSTSMPASMEAPLLSLLRRIVTTQNTANQIVLITVFADIAAKYPTWLIEFVHRSGTDAIVFFMERWLSLHHLLRAFGHYQVKLSVVGLTSLLLVHNKILESLRIRSAADQQTVGIPVGILTILCQEYKRSDWESTFESVPSTQQGTNKPDGGVDEDDEVGGPGSDVAEDGSDYDDYDDDDNDGFGDEGEDLDLPFIQSRPLFRVDLKQYLENSVRAAIQHGMGEFLTGMYWDLAPPERPAFTTLWTRASHEKPRP